jgi:hypothetical protein
MVTHAERQQARLHLDKAERLHSHAWAALLVAVSLIVGGLFDLTIGIAGLCVLAGTVLTWWVGNGYVRAANRVLNAPYRRSPEP